MAASFSDPSFQLIGDSGVDTRSIDLQTKWEKAITVLSWCINATTFRGVKQAGQAWPTLMEDSMLGAHTLMKFPYRGTRVPLSDLMVSNRIRYIMHQVYPCAS